MPAAGMPRSNRHALIKHTNTARPLNYERISYSVGIPDQPRGVSVMVSLILCRKCLQLKRSLAPSGLSGRRMEPTNLMSASERAPPEALAGQDPKANNPMPIIYFLTPATNLKRTLPKRIGQNLCQGFCVQKNSVFIRELSTCLAVAISPFRVSAADITIAFHASIDISPLARPKPKAEGEARFVKAAATPAASVLGRSSFVLGMCFLLIRASQMSWRPAWCFLEDEAY